MFEEISNRAQASGIPVNSPVSGSNPTWTTCLNLDGYEILGFSFSSFGFLLPPPSQKLLLIDSTLFDYSIFHKFHGNSMLKDWFFTFLTHHFDKISRHNLRFLLNGRKPKIGQKFCFQDQSKANNSREKQGKIRDLRQKCEICKL